jgi:hypothetical protein
MVHCPFGQRRGECRDWCYTIAVPEPINGLTICHLGTFRRTFPLRALRLPQSSWRTENRTFVKMPCVSLIYETSVLVPVPRWDPFRVIPPGGPTWLSTRGRRVSHASAPPRRSIAGIQRITRRRRVRHRNLAPYDLHFRSRHGCWSRVHATTGSAVSSATSLPSDFDVILAHQQPRGTRWCVLWQPGKGPCPRSAIAGMRTRR